MSTNTTTTNHDPPWGGTLGTATQFAERHTVLQEFLPFAYRTHDPIAALVTIRDVLDGKDQLVREASGSELTKTIGVGDDNLAFDLDQGCLLCGWWPTGYGASSKRRYANPDYIHSHGSQYITDLDERREWLDAAATLGRPATVLAPAFGEFTDHAMTRFIDTHDIPYDARRKHRYTRLARTWKTIAAWRDDTDAAWTDIATAFDMPRETVMLRVQADAADFEPPADPTFDIGRSGATRRAGGDR